MKTSAVVCGLSLALLAAPAGAASGKFGGGGSAGGGGGASVGGGHEKTGESLADVGATSTEGEGLEREKKPWELYAVWETHRLVRQNDLNGDANNRLFNFFYFY